LPQHQYSYIMHWKFKLQNKINYMDIKCI
jgi:hypothetical protein